MLLPRVEGSALAPGGRPVMTRALRRGTVPAWTEQARAAGLTVEHLNERPAEPALWERLYRLWIAHADELRGELGEAQATCCVRRTRCYPRCRGAAPLY